VKTLVYLPDDLHARLRHFAVDQKISMSEAVRRAVAEYLNRRLVLNVKPKVVSMTPRRQVEDTEE
jgi:hypothetical protein